MKTCIFAGTFDPFTVGHKAVVDKLIKRKRKVIITVGENPEKEPFFSAEERKRIIKAAFKGNKAVTVIVYSGERTEYKKTLEKLKAKEYYRGIRNFADFEYEKKAEEKNKELYPDIETRYIAVKKYSYVSSTLVKERIKKNLDVKKYIPKRAYKTFINILKEKNKR